MAKKNKFTCKTEAQKKAIRAYYAKKKAQEQQTAKKRSAVPKTRTDQLPTEFPFWARLRIEKRRPALVIDEALAYDKNKKEMVDGYVHREVTHSYKSEYEEIKPNPNKADKAKMYLKRPSKKPKYLFVPLGERWHMPATLKTRYSKK